MSSILRQFIIDAYESRHSSSLSRKHTPNFAIQIDDQDDNDRLDQFCNIFLTTKGKDRFQIELIGNFPISKELHDLAEIYNGYTDKHQGKLVITLNLEQIDALVDFTYKLRKTSFLGTTVNNPNWLQMSARTISSLYRFMRIINEYKKTLKPKSDAQSKKKHTIKNNLNSH
jgi:hypothetical protein